MKRKLNKVGNGTLTVSLPTKFVKRNDLTKDDEVTIIEELNRIIITCDNSEHKKEIVMNIDKMDMFCLAKFLIVCYEEGYDTVTLNFEVREIIDHVPQKKINIIEAVHFLVNRLVTYEIISQTNKQIKITDISEKTSKQDVVVSRIFFLIEEYLSLLYEDLQNQNWDDLNAKDTRHHTITKYVSLANRIMHDNKEDKFHYKFLVMNYLDKAADFIRYSYQHSLALQKKPSKECLEMVKLSVDYIKTLRSLYFKFSYTIIDELDEIRSKIKKNKLKISDPKELLITTNITGTIEVLNGTLKSIIAINLPDD